MTQQEIQERNSDIALMLGLHHDKECVIYGMTAYTWDMLRFHSDWNWLMEAVEFIEKIGETKEKYGILVDITTTYIKVGKILIDFKITPMKKQEGVFIAVSDFAHKFNNKEL
jgi:hypothetical protein